MGRILIAFAIVAALAAGAFVYRRSHNDSQLRNARTCAEGEVC